MDGISIVTGMAVAVIGRYPCIFLHEMGHLGAAVLNGWTPFVLRCGSGRRIAVLKIGDLHFQFGLRPTGGLVRAAANSPAGFRVKWFFYILAGPVMTAGTIWGLWELLQVVLLPPTTAEWIPIAIGTLMLMQAIIFILTVLPQMANVDGLVIPNDGLQILRSITVNAKAIAEQYFSHQVLKGQIHLERGDQERAREMLDRACQEAGMSPLDRRLAWIHLLMRLGQSAAANSAMTSIAEDAHSLDAPPSHVLDALACLPLYFGYRELKEQAMKYIDQAIAEEPEAITLKGTKGGLLIESGKSEEGRELLHEVLAHTTAEHDKAFCSYYIALAHSELGDWRKGRELLSEAIAKYPDCIVRSRVAKLFWDKREITKAIA